MQIFLLIVIFILNALVELSKKYGENNKRTNTTGKLF